MCHLWRMCALGLLLLVGGLGATPMRAQHTATPTEQDAINAYRQWHTDYPTAYHKATLLTQSEQATVKHWGLMIQAVVDLHQGRYEEATKRFEALNNLNLDLLQRYALATEKMAMYQMLGHTEQFFEAHNQWQQMTRRILPNSAKNKHYDLAEYIYARGLYTLFHYDVEVGNITLAKAQLQRLDQLPHEATTFVNTTYETARLYTEGKAHQHCMVHLDATLQYLLNSIQQGDVNRQIALLIDIATWLHNNGETNIIGHRKAHLQLALTPPTQHSVAEAHNGSWQHTALHYALHLATQQNNQQHSIKGYMALAAYHTQQQAFDTAMHYLQEARKALPKLPMRATERDLYEQASIVAIALGDKPLSDKYRNAYLDLLNLTRLDKTQEATLYEQQQILHEAQLNTFVILGMAIIIMLLCAGFGWYWLHHKRQRDRIMSQILEDCDRAAQGLTPLHANNSQQKSYSETAHVYHTIAQYLQKSQATDNDDQQEREAISEAQAVAEHTLEQHKRTNVELRTKMLLGTGSIVYLDRLLHLLTYTLTPSDLDYGQQLLQRILTINQHLTTWVQMKTGRVNIRIETFDVQDVLAIIAKAAPALKTQGINLSIKAPEHCRIKADKTLTLFMLNTLVDNARKHTPAGGSITITVQPIGGDTPLAEIAVTDTGEGIEAERLTLLLTDKLVYDQQKRRGFGLLNCRGIMERYRKVSSLFAHCRLTGESVVGQGTRFAFTLPQGVMAWFIGLSLFFTGANISTAQTTPRTAHIPEPQILTIAQGKKAADSAFDNDFQPDTLHAMQRQHPLWEQAQRFTDSIYWANVNLNFATTLRYADSAIHYINAYVAQQPQYKQVRQSAPQLLRYDSTGSALTAPEILWYMANIRADYSLFLDLRNELAIAYLGLGLLDPYAYNNEVYLQLYRTVSHKAYMQAHIDEAINTTRSLHIALMLVVAVCLTIIVVAYIRRLHRPVVDDGYMRQRLKTCLDLLDTGTLQERLTRLLPHLTEFTPLSDLGITVIGEEHKAIYQFNTSNRLNDYYIQQAQAEASTMATLYQEDHFVVWPMRHEEHLIGYITLLLHEKHLQPYVVPYLCDVLRFVTDIVYTAVISQQEAKDNIEILRDQLTLKQHDAQQLYVQNAIIENILSALKHETMYFPTRLSQLLTTMATQPTDEQSEHLPLLLSMTQHYRELSQVLLLQATEQFALHTYQWQYLNSLILHEHLNSLVAQHNKVHHTAIILEHDTADDYNIYVEPLLVEILLRQLWQVVVPHLSAQATIRYHQAPSADSRLLHCSITLPFSLKQVHPIVEQLDCDYFAPEAGITPLLICKNIIRMHDQRTLHAGYRITITEQHDTTLVTTSWLRHTPHKHNS